MRGGEMIDSLRPCSCVVAFPLLPFAFGHNICGFRFFRRSEGLQKTGSPAGPGFDRGDFLTALKHPVPIH